MIIYRPTLLARIILFLQIIFLMLIFIYAGLFVKTLILPMRILAFISLAPMLHEIYIFNKTKVIIDDEKIEIAPMLFVSRTGILFWNEIAELKCEYFLFPEAGIINLYPYPQSNRKPLRFVIKGIPISLIKDILSHLPTDTKVYLYPYLKTKVERYKEKSVK